MTDSDISPERDEYAEQDREANRHTAIHEDKFWHGRYGDRSRRVRIDGEEWEVDTLVDLERLRRERSGEWSKLMRSTADETTRRVLTCLLRGSPRSYHEISEWVDASERTVKRRVRDLRNAGIVETVGNPVGVTFRDDDLRLLASDVLSFL